MTSIEYDYDKKGIFFLFDDLCIHCMKKQCDFQNFTVVYNADTMQFHLRRGFHKSQKLGLSLQNETKLEMIIRELICVFSESTECRSGIISDDYCGSDAVEILDFHDIYPSESEQLLTSAHDVYSSQRPFSSPKFNWFDVYKDISEDEICISNDMHINVKSRIKPSQEGSVIDSEECTTTIINKSIDSKRDNCPRKLRKTIKCRDKQFKYHVSRSQNFGAKNDEIYMKQLLIELHDEKRIIENEIHQKQLDQYTGKQIFEEKLMRFAEEYRQQTETMQQVAAELTQKIESLHYEKDRIEVEIIVLRAELEKEKIYTEELLLNLKIETQKLAVQLQEQADQLSKSKQVVLETVQQKQTYEAEVVRLQKEVSILTERMSTLDRANALTIKFAIENSIAQRHNQQSMAQLPTNMLHASSSCTTESTPPISSTNGSSIGGTDPEHAHQTVQFSSSTSPDPITNIPYVKAFDEKQFDLYRKYSHMDDYI